MFFFARFLSTLFSPYLLALPTPFFLIYKTTGSGMYAFKWTLFTAIFTAIVFLASLYAVKKGYFSDLDVSKRKQRPLLFAIIAAVSIVYLLAILILHGPTILFLGVISVLIAVAVLSLINTRIKASFHVAAMSSMIFGFAVFYGGLNLLFLLLIPLVAWSRLKVHRHTFIEVAVGCILGSVLTLVLFFLYNYIGVVSL